MITARISPNDIVHLTGRDRTGRRKSLCGHLAGDWIDPPKWWFIHKRRCIICDQGLHKRLKSWRRWVDDNGTESTE